jgi:hypothetical protein
MRSPRRAAHIGTSVEGSNVNPGDAGAPKRRPCHESGVRANGEWAASVRPRGDDDVTQFEQTKGSLHFAIDKPLPKRLVKKLVTTRMRQLGLKEK